MVDPISDAGFQAAGQPPTSILLVEDDPNDAAYFRRLLTDAGLPDTAVVHQTTLTDALSTCESRHFDAVLLDLGLPDSQDVIAVDRFVTRYPELPIIVLTGDRDQDRAHTALRTGAEDYLFKGETAHGRLLLRSVGYAIERKQTRDVMKRLEAHLLKAQRLESMEVLAGGVAHDFNNLLVGIMGNASMALADLSPGSDVRPLVAGIERSALAAAELTKQMLAYAGKGRFVVQVSDLSELVDETRELLRASIAKSATIRFDVTAEPLLVRMDATQIRQILMNLVTNASEALQDEQGGITVTTGQLIVDEHYAENLEYNQRLKPGSYAFVEVSDVGIGMDEETRSRIFDPFFSTKFAGRGLGLAASLGIARGHQGALRVYSEPGQGSGIKLYLPLASGPETGDRDDGASCADASASQTLLVVDDNEAVRAVTHRILTRAGYEVMLAEDGVEAVRSFKIRAGSIDGVLLDLTMPRMNGEEALRQLRALQPGVRVVLMSGYNEQEVIRRLAGRGLAGFIQKPFLPATLLSKLREVLTAEPPA